MKKEDRDILKRLADQSTDNVSVLKKANAPTEIIKEEERHLELLNQWIRDEDVSGIQPNQNIPDTMTVEKGSDAGAVMRIPDTMMIENGGNENSRRRR